jgi:hypothetical protein
MLYKSRRTLIGIQGHLTSYSQAVPFDAAIQNKIIVEVLLSLVKNFTKEKTSIE